jgi:thioredoxin 1
MPKRHPAALTCTLTTAALIALPGCGSPDASQAGSAIRITAPSTSAPPTTSPEPTTTTGSATTGSATTRARAAARPTTSRATVKRPTRTTTRATARPSTRTTTRATTKAGIYIAYSAYRSDPARYAGTKVVLYFHAPWCPACQASERELVAHRSSLPVGVTVVKADYDSQRDLKKKYGVTNQNTFVQVGPGGAEVKKWLGIRTIDDIAAQLA